MGLDEERVERIRLAALLHDIGCLGIEDYLVMKTAPLTPEEFENREGAHREGRRDSPADQPLLQDLVPGVELHQRIADGMGYPYGLKGDQIPLMARVVAVADSFDANDHAAALSGRHERRLRAGHPVASLRHAVRSHVVRALAELVTTGALEVKNVRTPVSFRMRKQWLSWSEPLVRPHHASGRFATLEEVR